MGHLKWYERPLFDGGSAVFIFFSLSGYVLSLAYWKGKQLPYGPYLIRRFFRIYVPYVAACLVAVGVGRQLFGSTLPLSPWFYATWHTPLTIKLIAIQLLTMHTGAEINTAFWSLRYEVEMSIIFPVLCWLIRRLGAEGSLIFGCLCCGFGYALMEHHPSPFLYVEIGATLLRGSCFVFGAVAAWKKSYIDIAFSRTPKVVHILALMIVLAGLYSLRQTVVVPCSCLLILFAQEGRAKRWLNTPIAEYLGKVSYSLYLVHGTVLFATVILLYTRLPFWLVISIYLVVSFVIADLFNRLIETPADQLGKRLAGFIARARLSTGPASNFERLSSRV